MICTDTYFTFYRNIPILIDGAHALGSMNLQLNRFSPDYYVSNCHKWFCCPKGSAFLYIKETKQLQIRPLVVSHGFDSGFNSEFIWTGKVLNFHIKAVSITIQERSSLIRPSNISNEFIWIRQLECKMHLMK